MAVLYGNQNLNCWLENDKKNKGHLSFLDLNVWLVSELGILILYGLLRGSFTSPTWRYLGPISFFLGLDSVEKISLSHNEISAIGCDVWKATPNIKEVYLGFNKILHLDVCSLTYLDNIKIFYLSDNAFELKENMFSSLQQIETMDLGGNNLTQLSGL